MSKVHVILTDKPCALNPTCAQLSAKFSHPSGWRHFGNCLTDIPSLSLQVQNFIKSLPIYFCLKVLSCCRIYNICNNFSFVKQRLIFCFPIQKPQSFQTFALSYTNTTINICIQKWQRWACNICAFILMWCKR